MKRHAFTLAEVLITLGIIGIVASMTLPGLVQKYRNKVVETRMMKFYSSINQAVKMAELEYGDKKIWYEDLSGNELDSDGNPIEGSSNVDKWFTKYLAPQMKIIKKTIKNDGRPTYYFADGSALAVVHDSESREWYFYTGNLDKCLKKYSNPSGICSFEFEFYPASTNVSWKYLYNRGFEPVKYNWDGQLSSLYNSSANGCASSDNRAFCAALIQYNGWKIPADYPLLLIINFI